jgi:hypothetical protein
VASTSCPCWQPGAAYAADDMRVSPAPWCRMSAHQIPRAHLQKHTSVDGWTVCPASFCLACVRHSQRQCSTHMPCSAGTSGMPAAVAQHRPSLITTCKHSYCLPADQPSQLRWLRAAVACCWGGCCWILPVSVLAFKQPLVAAPTTAS